MTKVQNFLTIVLWFLAVVGIHAQESARQKKGVETGITIFEHKTEAGETLYSISKKYNVPILNITVNNPQIIPVLKTGDILKIPIQPEEGAAVKGSGNTAPDHILKHVVRRKETLYRISREYGITVDKINEFNPGLLKLKRGDTILIPQWKEGSDSENSGGIVNAGMPLSKITHWVQSGETLYSISQKYGQSVASILEMNPNARELKTGMRLNILKGQPIPAKNQDKSPAFVYHTIASGETLLSISRKYNVSAENLVEQNPSLDYTFQSGMIIRVPGTSRDRTGSSPVTKSEEVHHVVKKGETLYGLSQTYRIPMSEILKYNPFLEKKSPRIGDTLLIVFSKEKNEAVEKKMITPGKSVKSNDNRERSTGICLPQNNYYRDKINARIAILIPVFLETNSYLNEDYKQDIIKNETDSTSSDGITDLKQDNSGFGIQFHGSSENFIHFYEGALLAIDSLQQMGIRVELNVFDTEQKPSKVRNLISSGKLDKMDLIIGPVFPGEQKELSDFAVKNQIPVVSPLSASDEVTKSNPLFYQVNPTREFIWQKTNEYLVTNYRDCNILVLQTGSPESVAEEETAKIKEAIGRYNTTGGRPDIRICDFRKDGFSGLQRAMTKERRNLIVIPSINEAEVSLVVSNIQALSADFEITLIGTNRFPQYESINPEQYHHGQLEYLTPYWPDYNQKVPRSFVNNFRDYFKTEPNQFSMQGYDVTFFFVKAVCDYGIDLPKCITYASSELVQGEYHFTKSVSGGFVNDGLRVIHYTPDYQIVRKMTFSSSSISGN